MHISLVQWLMIAVAVACGCMQAFIMRTIVRKKITADVAIFFRYNLCCVVAYAVSIFPFLYLCPEYFYIYWSMNTLLMVMEFLVMYEALVLALKPYAALIDLGKILFRWAAIFLLVAGLLTALATNGSETNRVVAAIDLMQRSLRLMQCGLLLLFFSVERRLGLSWRSYSMSVAVGMGAYAATDLGVSYLTSNLPALADVLGLFNNAVCLVTVSFWAYCIAQPQPSRRNVMDSPSRLIFQRWNEALGSYGYGKSAAASGVESFLPGIEKTVERVMARTMH